MVRPAAALVCFLSSFPALAASLEDELSACFLIDAPLSRLECYDALADRPDLPSGIGSGESAVNSWRVTDETSPVDGVRRVALLRESLDLGVDSGSALLALRCRQEKTTIILAVPAFVTADGDGAEVRYRIGSMEAVTEDWTVSEGRYLFGPQGDDAAAMIRHMAGTNDFAIRVPAADGRHLEFRFGLSGLAQHVPLLAGACRWDRAG